MKTVKLLPFVAGIALMACDNQSSQSVEEATLETQPQKLSYLMGIDNGSNVKNMQIELDEAAFIRGFKDGVAGREPLLSQEQIEATVRAFQENMQAKQEEAQKAAEEAFTIESEANEKEGEAFLAENGVKEGVETTESGLQYKIISEGTGPLPTVDSTVEVHYAGKLLDGTEFDSSIKRGVPAQFGVTQVIAGWTEALQLMPEGSKWELYIPASLAYGPGGTGPIGPNSTLIFEVELLKANVQAETTQEGVAETTEE